MPITAASNFERKFILFRLLLIRDELCEITISTISVFFFLFNIPTDGIERPKFMSIRSVTLSVLPAKTRISFSARTRLFETTKIFFSFLCISTRYNPFKSLSSDSPIFFPINFDFLHIWVSIKYFRVVPCISSNGCFLSGSNL